jgi:hypothetical protein
VGKILATWYLSIIYAGNYNQTNSTLFEIPFNSLTRTDALIQVSITTDFHSLYLLFLETDQWKHALFRRDVESGLDRYVKIP